MPSLYESTVNTGEVSSSNFTTLYNASGLSVPNAGAGSVTGNLNVGGNLTVQGNSLLIGDVTLQSTLSLPNYTFPLPDGSTDQVLVTDGNGNLYWTDVSSIPGADYSISATTATGGANLTLANTAGFTDSVKFAAGTNMSIVRTDANTITIATVADNIPDGTANGQVLVWQGGAWTANSTVTASASADRFTLQYDNSGAGVNSAIFLRKNYGATPYTTNDGVGVAFQLDSDSQATNQFAQVSAAWNASAPVIGLATNINNNTAGPFVNAATFSTLQATLPGDLAVNGGDITTTQAVASLFNTTATTINIGNGANTELNLGSPTGGSKVVVKSSELLGIASTQNVFNTVATTINLGNGATTAVNIGSPTGGSQVVIKSEELVGINATQEVFDTVATTVNAFRAANILNMGSAASLTTLGNNLSINGDTLKINASGAAADNFIYFNGTNESLKWNQADTRFEFSDQLYITQSEIPAILERRTLSTDVSPYELKAGIKLLNRVTDAANNDVVNTGPSVTFGRTSGATTTTERVFAGMGSAWDGATGTAQLQFTWTNDNFAEPTPGNFPGTYLLLGLESNQSKFYNDSLYIDYTAQGATHTATSITGGNTLVFGSAHGYTAGDRIIYTSTTQNGLTQDTYYYVLSTGLTSTQCRLGLTANGSAIALTNGTGLTLVFADLINRVGVNTGSPDYTLDVNGDLRVTGDIISSGITAGNITVGVVTDNTISTTTGALDITAASGQDVTLSTTAAADPVTIVRTLSNTTAVSRTLTLRADSTGTPVVGFGNQLEFETESTPGTFVKSGYIETISTAANAGVLDTFKMNFGLLDAGTSLPKMELNSLGNLQIDGDLTVTGTNITTGATNSAISVDVDSSVTNLPLAALTVKTTSTTTPVVGFGTAINFVGQTTVSNFENAGFIAVASTDVTPGSEDFRMRFGLMAAGATYTTVMDLDSLGNLQIDGDLEVSGDTIKKSGGTDVIEFSGTNTVSVPGLFQVEVADTDAQINIGSQAAIATVQTTTTAISPTVITSTQRNSMSGMITITNTVTSARHVLNFTVLRNGASSPMLTTFGEMYTGTALATFTADLSGGDIRVLATPASTNSTTFNVVRTASL